MSWTKRIYLDSNKVYFPLLRQEQLSRQERRYLVKIGVSVTTEETQLQ